MPHDSSASAASPSRFAAIRAGFGSLTASRELFLRQLWLRPLAALAVLAVVGWFMSSALERVLKEDLESSLQTLLKADVTALKIWMRSEQDVALSVAKDATVIAHVERMIARAEQLIDRAEAYRSTNVLRTGFWILFALLTLTAIAIAVSTAFMGRLKRQAQRAKLEARQLGQYTLDEKLGEGGMGVVYRAQHAMLQRPTAVKFLHPDKTNDETVARFEREVQLTSKLTHPNTIAVYDFGRTPEGVFYYAMEYLDGINLEKLVYEHGPLPDGRVIYLLRQACGSLAEAHEAGLIHRDIKPANIVVTARGGLYDLVKVLDFGLARAIDQLQQARVTSTGILAGTPLYMSPEAIDHPNEIGPASDLYALAAVGYYLLTGTPVFEGGTILEILAHHRSTPPEPPSQRLGKPISTDLTRLLLSCLAKHPDDRPASARAMASALAKCSMVYAWTDEDAARWWNTYRPSGSPPTASSPATSAHIDTTIDATAPFRSPVG